MQQFFWTLSWFLAQWLELNVYRCRPCVRLVFGLELAFHFYPIVARSLQPPRPFLRSRLRYKCSCVNFSTLMNTCQVSRLNSQSTDSRDQATQCGSGISRRSALSITTSIGDPLNDRLEPVNLSNCLTNSLFPAQCWSTFSKSISFSFVDPRFILLFAAPCLAYSHDLCPTAHSSSYFNSSWHSMSNFMACRDVISILFGPLPSVSFDPDHVSQQSLFTHSQSPCSKLTLVSTCIILSHKSTIQQRSKDVETEKPPLWMGWLSAKGDNIEKGSRQ